MFMASHLRTCCSVHDESRTDTAVLFSHACLADLMFSVSMVVVFVYRGFGCLAQRIMIDVRSYCNVQLMSEPRLVLPIPISLIKR